MSNLPKVQTTINNKIYSQVTNESIKNKEMLNYAVEPLPIHNLVQEQIKHKIAQKEKEKFQNHKNNELYFAHLDENNVQDISKNYLNNFRTYAIFK